MFGSQSNFLYYGQMQNISSLSKFLLLVLLSSALVLTWLNNNLISEVAAANILNIRSDTSSSLWFVSPHGLAAINTARSMQASATNTAKPLQAPKAINELKKSPLPNIETIWKTISKDFQLNHYVQTAEVQKEIRRIQNNRAGFYKIMQASQPYINYIYQQVRSKNLPAELALIPYVESEFNPNDVSTKGAVGLWQLMIVTAKELGVSVRKGYDGRKDLAASTKAALAYFKDLGVMFKGNWHLAIAAYNCGQGRVAATIKKAKSSNYWNLTSLPTETKYYVPRLLAVAAIVKDPEKYGVKLPEIKDETYSNKMTLITKPSADTSSKTKISTSSLKLTTDHSAVTKTATTSSTSGMKFKSVNALNSTQNSPEKNQYLLSVQK